MAAFGLVFETIVSERLDAVCGQGRKGWRPSRLCFAGHGVAGGATGFGDQLPARGGGSGRLRGSGAAGGEDAQGGERKVLAQQLRREVPPGIARLESGVQAARKVAARRLGTHS